MYTRYLALEKLMYQLRQSSIGNIKTNIRLGKTDFICRQKLKQDTRKWKDITPLEIPHHIARPDLDLLKNNDRNEDGKTDDLFNMDGEPEHKEQNETKQHNEDTTDKLENYELDKHIEKQIDKIIDEDNTNLSETTGSISKKLKITKNIKDPLMTQQQLTKGKKSSLITTTTELKQL